MDTGDSSLAAAMAGRPWRREKVTVDISSKNGLLGVRIRTAVLLAASAGVLGCSQDAWRTAARRLRPADGLSRSTDERFGRPAHVAIGTRRPLPEDWSRSRPAVPAEREKTAENSKPVFASNRQGLDGPAGPGPAAGSALGGGPRRPQSSYEPAGFPKNPFVADVDRQLKDLREAEARDNPFADTPVANARSQTPAPEKPRIASRTSSPFETADPPVEAPVARANPSLPAGPAPRNEPVDTRPVSAIRPVALKVTETVNRERGGRRDPAMIVDSDKLPPRLETGRGQSAGAGEGSGMVRELEGPGEPPAQSADRRTNEWMPHPERDGKADAVAEAAPPPPVADLPQAGAGVRVAQRERPWSGSRTMKNVRWNEAPERAAGSGIPRPSMPIMLAAVLLALAAWSRFRRRSAT